MDYIVEQVNENTSKWEILKNNSLQATPFIRTEYLNCIGWKNKKYIIIKNDNIVGGFCLPYGAKPFTDGRIPYSAYQGVLFLDNYDKTNKYSYYKKRYEITTALVNYIDNQFNDISFANHWTVTDIRAFDWYNYHSNKKRFRITPFYSAIKKLNEEDIVLSLSQRRKRDYNKARRINLKFIEMDRFEEDIIDIYISVFQKQDQVISKKEINTLKKIIMNALEYSYGKLYATLKNNKIISFSLILNDNFTAYYMFGANNEESLSCGASTFTMVNCMLEAQKNGMQYFDFVGANSPKRGDYKLSYNSELVPYYVCNIK